MRIVLEDKTPETVALGSLKKGTPFRLELGQTLYMSTSCCIPANGVNPITVVALDSGDLCCFPLTESVIVVKAEIRILE